MRLGLIVFLGFMLVAATPGCVSSKGASGKVYNVGDVHSVAQLVAYLDDMGMRLEPVGILNNSRLVDTQAANIFVIQVRDMEDYVMVFEFHDQERAHFEARRMDVGYLPPPPASHTASRSRRTIDRRGNDLGTPIPLGRRPPVFQHEHIVVIHYGYNASMTTTLGRVFGRNITR